ncbi:hypothetical protein [uncultured Tateyamaria sp.]|uniref:hypothetical protein n=1 Tax=uncultured Tateyamaria sp. TaxID=455651 RepID=UPI00261DB8A7|nr:hypothetical protein [uncultured Tateyamaria sp.]
MLRMMWVVVCFTGVVIGEQLQAQPTNHVGTKLQSSGDVRVLRDSGRIVTLFEIYGFGQESYYDQPWAGTVIERKHSLIYVRDKITGPARVAILICGGGQTTVDGCKGLATRYKNSHADIIIAVGPNSTMLEELQGTRSGAIAANSKALRDRVAGYTAHDVEKSAAQIVRDLEIIFEAHPKAHVSVSVSSLGYPVAARLFGDQSPIRDKMTKLLTLDADRGIGRLEAMVFSTPARGFGGQGWFGPRVLRLLGVLAPAILMVAYDGERLQYASPKFTSDGPMIETTPFALIRDGTEKNPERRVWKRGHSNVNDKVIQWIVPGLLARLYRTLTPKSKKRDFSGQLQVDEALAELEASDRFANSEAKQFGLRPKTSKRRVRNGKRLKARLGDLGVDTRGGIDLEMEITRKATDLAELTDEVRGRASGPGPMRVVSLKELQRRARACWAAQSCSSDVLNLGGLTELQGYVLDPEHRDILLIGMRSDAAPIRFGDWLVALKAAHYEFASRQGSTLFVSSVGVSIDPQQHVLRKLGEAGSRFRAARGPMEIRAALEQWRKVCGTPDSQVSRVEGLPFENGRAPKIADIMLELDVALKYWISNSTRPQVEGYASLLELYLAEIEAAWDAGRGLPEISGLSRFWVSPTEAFVSEDPSTGAAVVDRFGLQLLSEAQQLDGSGRVSGTGHAGELPFAWARLISGLVPQIIEVDPLWARVAQMAQALLLAEMLRDGRAEERSALDLTWLRQQAGVLFEPYPMAYAGHAHVEIVTREEDTLRGKRVQTATVPSCGGVSLAIKRQTRISDLLPLAEARSRSGRGRLFWEMPDAFSR